MSVPALPMWGDQMDAILGQYRNAMMGGAQATGPTGNGTPMGAPPAAQSMTPFASSYASPMQYGGTAGGGQSQQPQETNWASSLADILQGLGEKFQNRQKQQQLNTFQDFSGVTPNNLA